MRRGYSGRMKTRIFWVGKTKEQYLTEGIDRYIKMLGPMAQVSIIEIKEEKTKARGTALAEEGKRILKQTRSYMLLDERGREYSSTEFAGFLKDRSAVDFVIGGPFGVSEEVKEKAAGLVSLSRMTFTHEMVRLFFMEQFYRAMTILKGKGYHH